MAAVQDLQRALQSLELNGEAGEAIPCLHFVAMDNGFLSVSLRHISRYLYRLSCPA